MFELFRDCRYSFQGFSELISITVTVPCFSSRMQLQERIAPTNFQEFSAIAVTSFIGFRILNVVISKRTVIFKAKKYSRKILRVERIFFIYFPCSGGKGRRSLRQNLADGGAALAARKGVGRVCAAGWGGREIPTQRTPWGGGQIFNFLDFTMRFWGFRAL